MTTVDDPRPMLVKVAAADPEVRDELIRWFDAAQALSVEAAGLRNSWQIAEGRSAALLAEVERLRAVRDAAAKYAAPAPSPSPDLAALREAFSDLLWWAEFTSQEDWHSLDLADTDEESDRRWELHQTFSDRAKLAAWLRAALEPSGWTWGGWLPLGLP